MTTNVNAPNNNSSLGQYMAQAVAAGNVVGIIYPDEGICQYVAAAVAAGTADVPGAGSLNVAQMMRAILGN